MTVFDPLWRSLLFVPINIDRFIESASQGTADAYILDLEDSIPANEKYAARKRIGSAVEKVKAAGSDILIRINRPWELAIHDIQAGVDKDVCALVMPKVSDAGHVRSIHEMISEIEIKKDLNVGHTKLIAMIESADAYFEMKDIARSSSRLIALTLGQDDFALSTGIEPTSENLLQPSLQIVFAARAAGILPLGFSDSISQYRDQKRFRQTVRHAQRIGFTGAFCIHPLQVAILNQELTPTEAEVSQSEQLIKAYEQAESEGRGSLEYKGTMVDAPIVSQARVILQRHRKISEQSQKHDDSVR